MSLSSGFLGLGVASLVDLLRLRAAEQPDREGYLFLRDGEIEVERLTYGGLDRRAREIASILQETTSAGDRTLLLFPPGLDFIAAFFGCLYAGVIAIPVYPPRLGKDLSKLRAITRDAAPRVALTTAALALRMAPALPAEPDFRGVRWLAVDEAQAPGSGAASWREPRVNPGTVAFLQYTSGSTGDPKGVAVSHGNLLHNEAQIQRVFGQDTGSVIVGWLPLYHDMGLIGNVLQPLAVGGRCILMSPPAFLQQPLRWLRAISRYRATTSGGPNFAYELCVRRSSPEERRELDLSSWAVAFNGAEPVRGLTLDRFAAAFAPSGFDRRAFCPCYGLAESTLMVAGVTRPEEPTVCGFAAAGLERREAVATEGATARTLVGNGAPLPDQEVAIVDPETLEVCRLGGVGEIWLQGPSVAQGYWNRPELNAQTFGARIAGRPGSFLRTGDLGFLAGGQLFLAGRLKDLIIVRGRNLYPQDIETTAEASHPALRAGCGAAFAVEIEGEERLVVVQEIDRRHEAVAGLAAEAIRRAVAERHEVQVYEVVLLRAGAITKTSSGKVQRHTSAAAYRAGTLTAVGRSLASLEVAEATELPAVAVPGREELLRLDPPERRHWLAGHLRHEAARVLRLGPLEIDPRRPLSGLGLDSLAAIELAHAVETQWGVELPQALLLAGASTEDLTDHLLAGLSTTAPPADPAPGTGASAGESPLSAGQRALYFLERLAPGNAALNIAVAVRVSGPLDPPALARAFERLAERHPALRHSFGERDGEPFFQVRGTPRVDFASLPAGGGDAESLAIEMDREAYRPFDLTNDPLLRVRLYPGEAGKAGDAPEVALLLTVHHLVADFWSLSLLARDLGLAYRSERGEAVALPPASPAPALTYAEYVSWQRQHLAGPAGERLRRYWEERLQGPLPALDLPTDRLRPPVQTYRGAAVARRWGVAPTFSLGELGRQRGATLFATLLAAFDGLLHRYTGQEELLLGAPAAARTRPELAELVGYVANPVVLRGDLSGHPTFAELLDRVRGDVLGALAHQDYPFPLLAERLQLERDPGRTPVFQAMFALQSPLRFGDPGLAELALGEADAVVELADLRFTTLRLGERRAQFDLMLTGAATADGLLMVLQYNDDLFDATTTERFLGHFEVLLAGAAAEPEARVVDLPLLTAAEGLQLAGLGATAAVEPSELCLHELFEAQVARTPAALALSTEAASATYLELNTRANRLAGSLRHLGVGPEVRVGVLLERSADLVVALLAVLKAGGAYVPLDPGYPRERLDFMLADAGAAVLLTRAALAGRLSPGEAVVVDLGAEPWAGGTDSNPGESATSATSRNLAYLIYTSGSTGRPKAVAIEHRSPVALVQWARTAYTASELAGVLAATSVCFDLSIFELFVPLSCGGTVILAENALALPTLAAADAVTLLNTVPSVLAELLRNARLPPGVRTVNLAGEPLRGALVEQLAALGTVERILNLYGPSEDTTYSTWTEVAAGEIPTLGRPLPGTRAYLLDARQQKLPVGLPGEICLAGEGLARGYLGRPELTAERFLPDPFTMEPGSRLYRTGDLAKLQADGRIVYLGRLDFQVKVRGFRIELGEVEAVLDRYPGLAQALVLVRDDAPGGRGLVAYTVPFPGATLDPGDLRLWLGGRLPQHTVPVAFVVLAALPLTRNGKVDRQALPAPAPATESAGAAAGPFLCSPVEEVVAGIWMEVLGREPATPQDNFFALGGHSLLGTRVLARVRRDLGVDLPLLRLFERPTLEGLAHEIERLRGEGAPVLPPLAPLPPGAEAPLSFGQERLWFLDQLMPGGALYNMPAAVALTGDLAPAALAASLDAVVERHAVLRSFFVVRPEGPAVRLSPPAAGDLPLVDLARLPAAARGSEAERLSREEAHRPFDLARGPLLRAALLRLAAGEHLALLTVHHIVSDGVSMGVLWRDLGAFYGAAVGRRPVALPALGVQYGDFAAWQRRCLDGELLEREVAHWRHHLSGAPDTLDLPTDRPRPRTESRRGASRTVLLPEGLRALAQAEGGSLFMLLLAGFTALLSRYTGRLDLLVGTPVSVRDRVETEPLIGLFVNTVVLRADLSGLPSFRQHLRRLREEVLTAHAHQLLPFERLVERLRPERDLALGIQAVLGIEGGLPPAAEVDGLVLAPRRRFTGTAKFDWTLTVAETGAGLAAELEYARDLFDAPTAERALGHLATLLAAALAEPAGSLGDLALLSAAERAQLLVEWNDAASGLDGELCIHQLFERQAREAPDRIALVSDIETWSYGELDRRATALALRLAALGVGPDVPVALCLDRSPEMLLGLLGILKAGGAYLPLDPTYPGERLSFLLADSAAPLLLTRRELVALLPDHGALTVFLEDLALSGAAGMPAIPPPAGPSAQHLAYLIYTSGSTGRPKGVEIQHGGVVNFLRSMAEKLGIRVGDTLLAVTTLSFDIAALELFLPLTTGARVALASRETAADALRLAERIRTLGVTFLQATPATWRLLLEGGWEGEPQLTLLCGGEALPADLAALLLGRGAALWNLYGPTETTIWSAALRVTAVGAAIAVGPPLANTRLRVLDAGLAPLPVGVPGELYIGGAGLARAYRGRPDLSAERFVPDPFAPSCAAGDRLYRTGDIVRYRTDGTLEFLGRTDHQVKLRGYRIELQEIEAALRRLPAVMDAVVVAREERLHAYYVPAAARQVTAAELRAALAEQLPTYMVPSLFTALAALPMTPSGKIDRKALPLPERGDGEDGEAVPAGLVEELLAGLWAEVLGRDRVGMGESFFDLGGHSLLATRLLSRVRQTFRLDLPLRRLFEYPSVAELAAHLRPQLAAAGSATVPISAILASPGEGLPALSFAQERLWFLAQLDPGSAAFNLTAALRLEGPLAIGAFARSLERVVARHEVLRATFEANGARPVQKISPACPLALPYVDLCGIPERERQPELLRLAGEEEERAFDLGAGPLLRATLVALSGEDHGLLLNIHHIVSDGWSLEILLREVVGGYRAFVSGVEPAPPSLPLQYADFARWQRAWLSGPVLDAQLEYWTRLLAEAPTLRLPIDRPRPAVSTGRGAVCRRQMPERLAADLEALARREGATFFLVLMAGFKALLHACSGEDDLVLGIDVANRNGIETEGLIGLFVNQLALRSRIVGNTSFREFVSQLRTEFIEAHAHQDLPFEKVVEVLRPKRNSASSPIFQVKLNLHRRPSLTGRLPGLELSRLEVPRRTVQLDLILNLEAGPGFKASMEYSRDLFQASTIDCMLGQFECLLERVVDRPEVTLSELAAAVEADERERVAAEQLEVKGDLQRRLRQVPRKGAALPLPEPAKVGEPASDPGR